MVQQNEIEPFELKVDSIESICKILLESDSTFESSSITKHTNYAKVKILIKWLSRTNVNLRDDDDIKNSTTNRNDNNSQSNINDDSSVKQNKQEWDQIIQYPDPKERGIVSILILNAIREACRPFLDSSSSSNNMPNSNASLNNIYSSPSKSNSNSNKHQQGPQPSDKLSENNQSTTLKYDKNADFPPLQKNFRQPENRVAKTKMKKRIRPTAADPTAVAIAKSKSSVWNANLVEQDDKQPMMLPLPKQPILPSTPVSKSAAGRSKVNVSFETNEAPVDDPQNGIATPAYTTPIAAKKPPPAPFEINQSNFFKDTMKGDEISKQCKDEERDDNSSLDEKQIGCLNNLVDVYNVLIINCLVPSTAVELQLLLRLLSLSTTSSSGRTNKAALNQGFFSIFSSVGSCVYFAKASLQKLQHILQGLNVLILRNLVEWPTFRHQLPALAEKLNHVIAERVNENDINIISLTGPSTSAILTLPFKEERDSRHNFKTREEQAIYKNRETSRDAFLYQLRSFLNVRGKVINSEQANWEIQKLLESSSQVIAGLMDTNIPWFTEFFCDMLLQIGLVPLQETDKELLNMADQDRLQKLHNRILSPQKSNGEKSTSKLITDYAKHGPDTPPVQAAQPHFPGHQEFFFTFILSADSYTFNVHLRSLLINKMIEIMESSSIHNAEKHILELCLLGRFLGVLTYCPNWKLWKSSGKDAEKSCKALDCTKQLHAVGLPLLEIFNESLQQGRVTLNVPWIVELLKMSRWDRLAKYSLVYMEILISLRQLQLELQKAPYTLPITLSNCFLVSQCLESFFNDTVGLLPTASLTTTTLELPKHFTTIELQRIDTLNVGTPNDAVNHRTDDLASFVAKLSRNSSEIVKTPGATRKLRPSTISPHESSITMLRISPNGAEWKKEPIKVEKAEQQPIQSKLRERFFHQHSELKTLCEFAVARALRSIKEKLGEECIQPHLSKLDAESISDDSTMQGLKDACQQFCQHMLETMLREILAILGPSESDPVVFSVAIKYSVSHAMVSCNQVSENIINSELQKMKKAIQAESKRQLFKDTDTSRHQIVIATTKRLSEEEIAMQEVTNSILALLHSIKADPKELETILSMSENLVTLLGVLKNVSTPDIPTESILRAHFTAILELDDWSWNLLDNILVRPTNNVDEFCSVKFEILMNYLLITSRIQHTSQYGLRNVCTYFASIDRISALLELGSQLNDIDKFGNIVDELINSEVLSSSAIKEGLRNLEDNNADLALQIRNVMESKLI